MADPNEIIQGLMARGLALHHAQGIAANNFVESGYDTGINETSPLVKGSRGGYGLNQWTGPRRVSYEAFAKQRGVPANDLNAQLDFTMQELQGPERGAYVALLETKTAADAAKVYSTKFLRPGIPHLDRRVAEANRLAGSPQPAQNSLTAQYQAPQQQPEQQNALLPPELISTTNNVADFLTQPNRLATVGFDQQTNPFLQYTRQT